MELQLIGNLLIKILNKTAAKYILWFVLIPLGVTRRLIRKFEYQAFTPLQTSSSPSSLTCLTLSFSGSICTSCPKNMTENLPSRARTIYCWKKGVKGGLMGRRKWTTPQELWAGQLDNSTHKERSASIRRLFDCNKNETNTEFRHSESVLFYWELIFYKITHVKVRVLLHVIQSYYSRIY